jgi:hypothetical protein
MPNQSGPKSTAGKLASCMNNFRHGATSTTLFLKDEDPKQFFALLENAFEQHQPYFDQDAALVTDSVRARWILTRRQRIADGCEGALIERKGHGRTWLDADFIDMTHCDRYVTQARRQLSAALRDLQLIQKMARDEQRWRQQLIRQKETFALDVQRFELMKEREANRMAKIKKTPAEIIAESASTFQDVQADEQGPHIPQGVYVGVEDGVTQVFDRVPTNDEVESLIANADQFNPVPVEVVRTYIFAGRIPPEYEWLITADWERKIENQKLRKTFSFDEWRQLAANEEQAA